MPDSRRGRGPYPREFRREAVQLYRRSGKSLRLIAEVIDPRGNQSDYAYDLAARLIEADEPLSTSTGYGYDPAGNLSSLTDPNGHSTTFDHDSLGRLIAIHQPLAKCRGHPYPSRSSDTRSLIE